MLTDDGKHLYVSWDEYHLLIERLALKVHNSGWEFEQILCLARGGMRPGDVLSRVFDKPLAIMSTSSYRAESGTIQGRLDMAKYITMPKGELAGRVLLVDDLADSGVTLRAVVDRLRGMLIGSTTDCVPAPGRPSLSLRQVVEEVTVGSRYPIVWNVKAGHLKRRIVLPLGARATIDTTRRTLVYHVEGRDNLAAGSGA